MKNRQLFTGLGASIGMMVLILDGKTALEGAKAAVELCLWTVIPSLFPFFILSVLLTGTFFGQEIPLLRPLGKIFSLPSGTEALMIPAFLGGYPAGAQSISQAYRTGHLKKEEAERLLAFCSNAGPAFLFGMTGPMFPEKWMVWALWAIHIGSAYLVCRMFPGSNAVAKLQAGPAITVTGALLSAIRIMAQVCSWVMLFRVFIGFLRRWVLWILPTEFQVAICGLLELSNGCCNLALIESVPLRFILCSGFLAFGGLCVTMQTASVTEGLSIRKYIFGKILQLCFSILLAMGVMVHPAAIIPCCFPFFYGKIRNNSRNPAAVGV